MSFREKSAWISLVLLLGIFGTYFWNSQRVLAGRLDHDDFFRIGVILIVLFVVLEIVLHVLVAIQSPKEARTPKDERERLIEMKATTVAFHVLVAGGLLSIATIHFGWGSYAITQHVLLSIVVAELVKFGGQIAYYRRGA